MFILRDTACYQIVIFAHLYKENKHSTYFPNCFGISADAIKKLAGVLLANVAIVNK